MLKDTLGLSEHIEGIGEVYPVNIMKYERFKYLANKYFMIEADNLKFQYGFNIDNSSLDIIINELLAFELAKDEALINLIGDKKTKENLNLLRRAKDKWSIDEFLELFKIILKKDVYLDEDKKIIYIDEPLSNKIIDGNNFEYFRKIVFRQNLLFLQLYYEDEILQSMLMDLRKQRMERKDSNSKEDIEAIIQLLCLKSSIKLNEIEDLTYYQVMALYSRLNLLENYEWVKMVQTSGYGSKDIDIPKIDKSLDLNRHPESFEFVGAMNEVDSKIQK